MGKNVLLINDLPGFGAVALAAVMPVLAHLGHHVYNLPTALVSNTLDYGKFAVLDTTDYMKETLAVWRSLGISFDAVAAGFLASDAQADLVASYCREARSRGALIFVDPIMGDEGHRYNGIPETRAAAMRKLVAEADLICPNYTEASLLTGRPWSPDGVDRKEMEALIDSLRELGPRSVVVTSIRVDGKDAVAGYDGESGAYFVRPFVPVPVRFPGTGDIFSAVLLGHVLSGRALPEASAAAMDAVAAIMERNKHNADPFWGIPLETCMEVID